MTRLIRLLVVVSAPLLLGAVLSSLLAIPAKATPSSTCEPDGQLPSGAYYRICMPAGAWKGDLVLYAHGYVAYNKPITIPEDQLQLSGGASLPELINALGYAFATTSYRVNGLAVEKGVDDLVELAAVFSVTHGLPAHIVLSGVSEGGLITALAIERRPDVFKGGLATCGPIGDSGQQNQPDDRLALRLRGRQRRAHLRARASHLLRTAGRGTVHHPGNGRVRRATPVEGRVDYAFGNTVLVFTPTRPFREDAPTG